MNAPADWFVGRGPSRTTPHRRALMMRRARRLGRTLAYSNRTLEKLIVRCISGIVSANDEKTAMDVRQILIQCRARIEEKILAANEAQLASYSSTDAAR